MYCLSAQGWKNSQLTLKPGLLRRSSPGHVCLFLRCTGRCQAPGQARLVKDTGQRGGPTTGGFRASQGPRHRRRRKSVHRAGVADQGCGRPRLQPSDPGPDSTSLPAPAPLTEVESRRPLNKGRSRGPRKRIQRPSRKREQRPLPAPPASRKSRWRRWARASLPSEGRGGSRAPVQPAPAPGRAASERREGGASSEVSGCARAPHRPLKV